MVLNVQKNSPQSMIATLGVEPQVVTIALDKLRENGNNIHDVTVIYTEHPAVKSALNIIRDEFKKNIYPGISLQAIPVSTGQQPIRDFHAEKELRALLRTLYSRIREARQMKSPIHLCISGGRKVMGIMAMTVAQLLFGPDDRLWYLITKGWEPSADRHLHVSRKEEAQLVNIPVLRWQEAGTLMQAVTELDDPHEVLAWYHRLTKKAEERRQGEFIRHWLTPAERKITRLACRGFNNASIATKLHKQEQTVANQLHHVYEKLTEWLGYPNYNVDRNVLIARFSPYFTIMEPKDGL